MMDNYLVKYLMLLSISGAFCNDALNIVRGVALEHQSFYANEETFTCFDGSMTIPHSSVNDDYCDCLDGTDEPGTAACPTGRFYCENVGHKSLRVPSSLVNDGICDCCDGSDEYESGVACFNQCQKLGAEERERRKHELAEANAGFDTKKQWMQKGQEIKTQKQKRIEEISTVLTERKTKLEELKVIKEAAEAPEKEAKDRHQKSWEELKAKLKEEKDNIERGEAFALLDTDKDGWVTAAEIMHNNHLSDDITESDTKDLLGGEEMVDSEKFIDVWSNIRPKYLKDGRPVEKKPEDVTEESMKQDPSEEEIDQTAQDQKIPEEVLEGNKDTFTGEDNIDGGNDDDDDDDSGDEDGDGVDDEDDHAGDGGEHAVEQPPQTEEDKNMPEYDEETKKLISAADEARKSFNEEDLKVRTLEAEHKDLKSYLDTDFGQDEEFSSLKGECFEYTDREYTYKLCPFEKVTQRPKNGGGETDLGRWGKWEPTYSRMKYENGQSCWNGPTRSTSVRLSCGKENAVISVVEPSRCEYEMEFKTPAVCTKVEHLPHDEF